MAFRILPDAQEKVREYEELVAACRRGVKKVRCTDPVPEENRATLTEREFVSVYNRLFTAFTAKQRELRKKRSGDVRRSIRLRLMSGEINDEQSDYC